MRTLDDTRVLSFYFYIRIHSYIILMLHATIVIPKFEHNIKNIKNIKGKNKFTKQCCLMHAK